jgi:hypothetical protein
MVMDDDVSVERSEMQDETINFPFMASAFMR